MRYESLHNLIRDTLGAIDVDTYFYHGSEFNLNSEAKERYPLVWLNPSETSLSFINDSRTSDVNSVVMLFLDLDKINGDSARSNNIVFNMDTLARKFAMDLNVRVQDIDIVIEGVRITPFIKVKASVLTGVILRFNITSPDDVEYC